MIVPVKPEGVNPAITQPTPQFIRETYKVGISILGFILVYLILLATAIAIAFGAGYLGYRLVIWYPAIFTLIIGLVLCLFGFMIIAFLVKFITSKNERDISHLKEISSENEPHIFKFIHTVADEVGTPLPKKIFLSNEVNAYVFYDSNFWSLLFPVKKNLVIGLGLINSINLSEFKSIIAHEFGHFSQKSMKLGSYIYYVNRVIHDMLNRNNRYEEMVTKLRESDGYLIIAGELTFLFVRATQFILRMAYKPINLLYLALSREMEFHADAIAASVTGSNHSISSLHRIEMGDICFNTVLSKYNEWNSTELLIPINIYENHKVIQKIFAEDHDLGFENDIIGISNINDQFATPRVSIKDQWASHPSTQERIEFLKSLNLTTNVEPISPWSLFADSNKTQEEFTERAYSSLTKAQNYKAISNDEFSKKFKDEFKNHKLPKEYHGLFDGYFPIDINIEQIISHTIHDIDTPILDKGQIEAMKDRTSIANDLAILNYIKSDQKEIKSFDFDGKKYNSKKAESIYNILHNELESSYHDHKNKALDIFHYFFNIAKNRGTQNIYISKFDDLISKLKENKEENKTYNSIQNELSPIFEGDVLFKVAETINKNVQKLEVEFKRILREKVTQELLSHDDLNEYLSQSLSYFSGRSFNDDNLELLITALNVYQEKTVEDLFNCKNDFLKYQLALRPNHSISSKN